MQLAHYTWSLVTSYHQLHQASLVINHSSLSSSVITTFPYHRSSSNLNRLSRPAPVITSHHQSSTNHHQLSPSSPLLRNGLHYHHNCIAGNALCIVALTSQFSLSLILRNPLFLLSTHSVFLLFFLYFSFALSSLFFPFLFCLLFFFSFVSVHFSRLHATLFPTVSVRHSVGLLVRCSVCRCIFSVGLEVCCFVDAAFCCLLSGFHILAPANQHGTNSAL